MNCEICGLPADIHHIITRKAYGGDSVGFDQPVNLMRLCRVHHTEVHYTGCQSFADKYGLTAKYNMAKEAYRAYERAKYGRE